MICSSLPKGTIVASNSLVNTNIEELEDNCLVGGTPAKVIAKGFKLINNPEIERIVTQRMKSSIIDCIQLDEELDF